MILVDVLKRSYSQLADKVGAETVDEVIRFFEIHLQCTSCKTVQRDDAFPIQRGYVSRRDRNPVCKKCISIKRKADGKL